jgi:hypothetical protein
MIGSFTNGRNHYRGTYSSEYADAGWCRTLIDPDAVPGSS